MQDALSVPKICGCRTEWRYWQMG